MGLGFGSTGRLAGDVEMQKAPNSLRGQARTYRGIRSCLVDACLPALELGFKPTLLQAKMPANARPACIHSYKYWS